MLTVVIGEAGVEVSRFRLDGVAGAGRRRKAAVVWMPAEVLGDLRRCDSLVGAQWKNKHGEKLKRGKAWS